MSEYTTIEKRMADAIACGAYGLARDLYLQLQALRARRPVLCLSCGEDITALVIEHGTGEAAYNAHAC